MLLALGRCHCRIHLTVDAQAGEGGKRCLLPRFVVTHCLKKSEHALLDQILVISAHQVQRPRPSPHQRFVFVDQIIGNLAFSCPQPRNQLLIRTGIVIFHHHISCILHLSSAGA